MPAELTPSLAAIHRELGIPATYARDRSMPLHREVDEALLVEIGLSPTGRVIKLTPAAARAWHRMQPAAAENAVTLVPVSGFRSVIRQSEIIRHQLRDGRPLDEILRYVAAPGFSEHHTGSALDIGSPGYTDLEEAFATTPAFRWLTYHAADFGFRLSFPRGNKAGIGYEPWHWFFCPDSNKA